MNNKVGNLSLNAQPFSFVVPCIKTFLVELQCNVYIKLHWNIPTTDLTKALLSNLFSQPTKGEKSTCRKFKRERGLLCQAVSKELWRQKWKRTINRAREAGLSSALAVLFNWHWGCLESVGLRCHSSLYESEKTFTERWFRHFTWHHLLDFIKILAWSFHT